MTGVTAEVTGVTDRERLTALDQAPGTDAQAPGADAQAPGTDAQAPGTDAQAPGTDAQAAPPVITLSRMQANNATQ